VLTQHFDSLIRASVVQPPEVTRLLRLLLAEIEEHETDGKGRSSRHG
jgi:hypothetical protein